MNIRWVSATGMIVAMAAMATDPAHAREPLPIPDTHEERTTFLDGPPAASQRDMHESDDDELPPPARMLTPRVIEASAVTGLLTIPVGAVGMFMFIAGVTTRDYDLAYAAVGVYSVMLVMSVLVAGIVGLASIDVNAGVVAGLIAAIATHLAAQVLQASLGAVGLFVGGVIGMGAYMAYGRDGPGGPYAGYSYLAAGGIFGGATGVLLGQGLSAAFGTGLAVWVVSEEYE